MQVLVTGATGRTGRSIVVALSRAGCKVDCLSRSADPTIFSELDNINIIQGNLESDQDVERAIAQNKCIYHIPPNMHPKEIEIGKRVIEIASQNKVEHLVYHSVLHPQLQKLPHHWNKLFVEEAVIDSGLPYTIMQPSSYMQNLLLDWPNIVEKGVHTLAFSIQAKLSLVDLEDVAEVAAIIVGSSQHQGSIYELAGPQMLSGEDKARILSSVLNRSVRARQESLASYRQKALGDKIPEHVIETRERMFAHYDSRGLAGNSGVLAWLLQRSPTDFRRFVQRTAEII